MKRYDPFRTEPMIPKFDLWFPEAEIEITDDVFQSPSFIFNPLMHSGFSAKPLNFNSKLLNFIPEIL